MEEVKKQIEREIPDYKEDINEGDKIVTEIPFSKDEESLFRMARMTIPDCFVDGVPKYDPCLFLLLRKDPHKPKSDKEKICLIYGSHDQSIKMEQRILICQATNELSFQKEIDEDSRFEKNVLEK